MDETLAQLQETRDHLQALVDIIDTEQPDISWGFVAILDAARLFLDPTNGLFGTEWVDNDES